MIHNLWVLTKSGIPIYTKSYQQLNIENELLSGFFSALQAFANESRNANIEVITIGEFKFTFEVGSDITVILDSGLENNNILLRTLLRQIRKQFQDLYSREIEHFTGSIDTFDEFTSIFEEILIENETKINCETCSRLILDEFITVLIEDRSFFFCCHSCKLNYSHNQPTNKNIELMKHMYLQCGTCQFLDDIPQHCNLPMHVDSNRLICWMGNNCNSKDIPKHCGKQMQLVYNK